MSAAISIEGPSETYGGRVLALDQLDLETGHHEELEAQSEPDGGG